MEAAMATLTIEIPDELSQQLSLIRDQIPELLALSLHQPAIPAALYRNLVAFLAQGLTAAEMMAFRPTAEMQARLSQLLDRHAAGTLTPAERSE
jgi:predicted transcriptional regulator